MKWPPVCHAGLRIVPTRLGEGTDLAWWRVEHDAAGEGAYELAGFVQLGLTDLEIGFGILPRFRGRGLARAALACLLCEFGARRGGEVVAVTHCRNKAAQAVLRANGFSETRPPCDVAEPGWLHFACMVGKPPTGEVATSLPTHAVASDLRCVDKGSDRRVHRSTRSPALPAR